VSGILSTIGIIWRLSIPYFRSNDRRMGLILLAAVVAMELATVAINVLLNWWNAKFFNAIQEKNWDVFKEQLGIFCLLAAALIGLAVYQLYLRQWLEIRWRQWMTADYLDRWLDRANHYRMQLLGDAADNPDQRIAEDIRLFIEFAIDLSLRLLNSVVTLLSFVLILWALSDQAPLQVFGVAVPIPGYLVWAALIYAVIATAFTHLIGRPLVGLNFNRQRVEADFRFNLVRTRENAEQIALLRGEPAEKERLGDRFRAIVVNWLAIMSRTKKVTFFTTSASQTAIIFPYIVVSPAYFFGQAPLGVMTQAAAAFDSVQRALSFFMEFYRQLADWRAVIARLSGFDASIAAGLAAATMPPMVSLRPDPAATQLHTETLDVRLPDRTPLLEVDAFAVSPGEQVLLTGPTGSGKSTLFRAIDGIWPFGSGTITLPKDARMRVMPQRPYFPIGTLADAVAYPARHGAFPEATIREALEAVGLPAMAKRLNEEAHWNRMLSLGEQQRLAMARALLHAPDFLLLDEATASLDEPSEAALYQLLQQRLPKTAIVSIGHRGTLFAFHQRHFAITRGTNGNRLQESVTSHQ